MNSEDEKKTDELAKLIGDIILEAAEKHVPKGRRVKNPCISKNTLDLIEDRRELKYSVGKGEESRRIHRAKCKR